MLRTIKFALKIPLYFLKFIKNLSVILSLVFAFSVIMFSNVANTVNAILSTVGIRTASAELVSSVLDLKNQNNNLRVEMEKIQKTAKTKISNLEADLEKSKVAQKVEIDKNFRLNQQLNKTQLANNKIKKLSRNSVARGARLLSLNAGSTVVEAGVGWIPYAGLVLGAGTLAWEVKEICGQMDDMDEVADLLGAEPADRGKFKYLCLSDGDEIGDYKELGDFFVKEVPEEFVPSGAVKNLNLYLRSGYQSYGTEFEVRKLEDLNNLIGTKKYFKINNNIAEYNDGLLSKEIVWFELSN